MIVIGGPGLSVADLPRLRGVVQLQRWRGERLCAALARAAAGAGRGRDRAVRHRAGGAKVLRILPTNLSDANIGTNSGS
ncbi:hypothetical protein ACFOHS_00290 [Jhaorihella thermophila]